MHTHLTTTAVLALALTASRTPPQDLDLSLLHGSVQARDLVRQEPPVTTPATHQMHSRHITLTTPAVATVRHPPHTAAAKEGWWGASLYGC